MNEDEVLGVIRQVLAEQLECEVGDLPRIESLQGLGFQDDLDPTEVANELEGILGVRIPLDEHLDWRTLGDIHRSVMSAVWIQGASVQ